MCLATMVTLFPFSLASSRAELRPTTPALVHDHVSPFLFGLLGSQICLPNHDDFRHICLWKSEVDVICGTEMELALEVITSPLTC